MHALSVRSLSKTYKNGVQALKGIDLEVEQGDFFALLGPNGAGKTTLIGILTSLVTKSSGEARVFDASLDTNPSKAKTYLGLVPQEANFNIFEKVEDIITTQGGYYGMTRAETLPAAERILKDLGL